jgi:hypothetical protein
MPVSLLFLETKQANKVLHALAGVEARAKRATSSHGYFNGMQLISILHPN